MNRILLTVENQQSIIEQAVDVLSSGGLVVYPTETMYGVAADALNPEAVTKLLRYKNRPAGKAVSVLVINQAAAEDLVELNDTARNLYETFLPGPVTVVSKDKGVVDSRLVSELGTLGIRISSHPFATELVSRFAGPLSATSANASGKARPYDIDTLLNGLSDRQKEAIDLIIDAGPLPRREPSTVIDTTTEIQEVVRAGELFHLVAPPQQSHAEAETIAIAADLMKGFLHVLPEKAIVFALEGEMGAGKTRFAKGVAQALGVKEVISSPSYIIMNEYEHVRENHTLRFLHMDCWRLDTVKPEDFELDRYLEPYTVLVIEWAQPLLAYLQGQSEKLVGYHIFIESMSEHERQIKVGAL